MLWQTSRRPLRRKHRSFHGSRARSVTLDEIIRGFGESKRDLKDNDPATTWSEAAVRSFLTRAGYRPVH
jgi:hypothetical protein